MPIEISTITRADIPGAVDCIQKAFADDPYHEWVFDKKTFDPVRNRSSLTYRCEWGISNAVFQVAKDPSSSTPDLVIGVAMWMPSRPLSLPETWTSWFHGYILWFRVGLLNLWNRGGRGGLNVKRYYIWKTKQAEIQKRLWTDEQGYWFCNIVTVLPGHQGKGIGRKLFEEVTLKTADREGRRCYLESSRDEPNVGIYRKLGFEVVGDMRVEEGGEGCDLFCMIREPQMTANQ